MDFFGPFMLKGGRKAWGLLFTCCTSRAVHLEPCPDLKVGSWLNALERFISRRGRPQRISCDNATTFVGGNRALRKIVEEQLTQEFKEELTEKVRKQHHIDFHFIPPGVPHFGGIWETMVKQVQRSLLRSASTVAALSYDAFATFLARAENVVNRRPLAIGEDLEIITPAAIVAPGSEAGHGFAVHGSMSRVVGQLRQMVDHFWTVWTNQYLQTLSPHRLSPRQKQGYIELQPGDKVLFRKQENFHRFPGANSTAAGIIRGSSPAKDGITRIYDVEDLEGKVRQVPTKRIYLAEQDLVERRDRATGRVPG
jgi:hypothetical protein